MHKSWNKLFWDMAGGDKTQYDNLKRSDFVEFWDLRDRYESDIELKIKNAKAKKNA